jgi:hypothetical protein
LHIAIVLNASWNVFNFRLGLLRALEKAGHSISVIAPQDAYSLRLGFPHYDIDLQSRGRNPICDLRFFLDLCRLYRRLKPDIVLHFTPKPNIYGALAAAVVGIPSINNIAGLGTTFSSVGWTTRMIRFLYRVAMRFPQKVFFQNPEDLELFRSGHRAVPPAPHGRQGHSSGFFACLPYVEREGDRGVCRRCASPA